MIKRYSILEDSRQEFTNLITVNCYHIKKRINYFLSYQSLFVFVFMNITEIMAAIAEIIAAPMKDIWNP